MDGRFPFDNNTGQRSAQLNAAQMRAALGLSSVAGLDEAFFLQQAAQQQQQQQHQQQQLRQQELQRDIQLRRLLLQEHFDQQLQEQQIRAIGEQLHDFPDLQQHYQSVLLNERLQRQRRNSGMSGAAGSAFGGAASTAQQQLAAVQHQQQQQAAALQEQRLRAYEEQLLLQQQQQQQRQLAAGFRADELSSPSHAQSTASLLMSAAAAAAANQQQQQRQVLLQQQQHQLASQHVLSQNLAAMEALAGVNPILATASVPSLVSRANQQLEQRLLERELSYGRVQEEEPPSPPPLPMPLQPTKKRSHSEQGSISPSEKPPSKKKSKKKKEKLYAGKRKDSPLMETQRYLDDGSYHEPDSQSPSLDDGTNDALEIYDAEGVFETFALAADIRSQQHDEVVIVKGTFDDILDAASDCDKFDDAAYILATSLKEVEPWSDSDVEDVDTFESLPTCGLPVPTTPAESVVTPNFTSSIPSLPNEPMFVEDTIDEVPTSEAAGDADIGYEKETQVESKPTDPEEAPKPAKKSAILSYPCPIDTWWPSINGMRRERKSCGETSDEDNFEDEPSSDDETKKFRANKRKIRARLSRSPQPGVLEKLPHCRVHRIKTRRKKNSTAPDLVYCWQVTELYPQEIMVNCSRCGTWRHAACGGHHKPYSIRENTTTPFVAVCEHCHEEEKYLREFPHGEQRLERQRIEQLRRGLSTSTVMRHSSYSKHGGTYKWPLGSVSATHIGGHTRSVHARHDKAERQWNDMAARLGRGFGYRQKERVRSRTKELERLLVAIEDAEAFTDRHNMFLFLHRDTKKEFPAGFENEIRNIFDPADDEHEGDDLEGDSPPINGETDTDEAALNAKEIMPYEGENDSGMPISTGPIGICSRVGCKRRQRFDSRFCSDACGVATLEISLLHTLQDSSDIHPSVLRL